MKRKFNAQHNKNGLKISNKERQRRKRENNADSSTNDSRSDVSKTQFSTSESESDFNHGKRRKTYDNFEKYSNTESKTSHVTYSQLSRNESDRESVSSPFWFEPPSPVYFELPKLVMERQISNSSTSNSEFSYVQSQRNKRNNAINIRAINLLNLGIDDARKKVLLSDQSMSAEINLDLTEDVNDVMNFSELEPDSSFGMSVDGNFNVRENDNGNVIAVNVDEDIVADAKKNESIDAVNIPDTNLINLATTHDTNKLAD